MGLKSGQWKSSDYSKGKQNTYGYNPEKEKKVEGTWYKRKININDCSWVEREERATGDSSDIQTCQLVEHHMIISR